MKRQKKEEKKEQEKGKDESSEPAGEKEESLVQKHPVLQVFEDELQAELFSSRCNDIGEAMQGIPSTYTMC